MTRHLHLVEAPPDHPPSRAANVGFALLAAGVVAWEVLAPETLSSGFDRYLDHPIGKYVAIGGVALLGAHLLNLPEAFGIPDPIDYLGRLPELFQKGEV